MPAFFRADSLYAKCKESLEEVSSTHESAACRVTADIAVPMAVSPGFPLDDHGRNDMPLVTGNFNSDTYDNIVVGGGSAGCLIAARLSEDRSRKVLLIEAGGADVDRPAMVEPALWSTNLGSDVDWRYHTVPQPHVNGRVFDWNRGKVLGGCSSINATVWVWGHPSDFDRWAADGNTGWDFASLQPLFRQLETTLRSEDNDRRGTNGPMRLASTSCGVPLAEAFFEACGSAGHPRLSDVNGPVQEGSGTYDLTVAAGRRFSVVHAFLHPAIDRPNLTVLSRAEVDRLMFSGTDCVGVRCRHEGKLREFRASGEIILSAGALATPYLLMRSGIGNAADLGQVGIKVIHDLPGIGENLHDHCFINAFSAETAEPVHREGRLGAHLYTRSHEALSTPDIEVVISGGAIGLTDAPREKCFSLQTALLRPLSRGRLTLAHRDGDIDIDPNYLAEKADIDALCTAVEKCSELAASAPISRHCTGKVRKLPHGKAQILEFIRNNMGTYWHPVGTCAMGAGKQTVVDASLRVHGLTNLRVADSSVMPSITTGNTLAPTLVIAEQAARMISLDTRA
jgi:choline dehydrogenase